MSNSCRRTIEVNSRQLQDLSNLRKQVGTAVLRHNNSQKASGLLPVDEEPRIVTFCIDVF